LAIFHVADIGIKLFQFVFQFLELVVFFHVLVYHTQRDTQILLCIFF
jgi:hypothetical protein